MLANAVGRTRVDHILAFYDLLPVLFFFFFSYFFVLVVHSITDKIARIRLRFLGALIRRDFRRDISFTQRTLIRILSSIP